MTAKIKFDMKACGRCGGTGHYSYNTTDGSTCYGCSGRGTVRTTMARVAATKLEEWLIANGHVAVTSLKIGDLVKYRTRGGSRVWATVTEIGGYLNGDAHYAVTLRLPDGKTVNHGYLSDETVQRPLSPAEIAQRIEFARTLEGVYVLEDAA